MVILKGIDTKLFFKKTFLPWLVWLSWLEHPPINQTVVGLVPIWGMCERQPIYLSLSLSLPPSLPLSLKSISMTLVRSKKKYIKKLLKTVVEHALYV